MNKRIVAFALALLLGSAPLAAQDAVLRGEVRDAVSDEILPGVRVNAGDGLGTSSDKNGLFYLALDEGAHTIVFSLPGYMLRSENVNLQSGKEFYLTIRLEPEKEELDVVVVSAGKFEQKLGEVTVSMEVLNPELVQDRNTTSVEYVLQQAPGVSIVDSEPQIRSGSGYSFGAGSRVQVLVDDLPMLSGDAGKASWGFLPVENLEQIEVVKGASSVLYGSSALSGVINLRTSFPGNEPLTRLTVFHGVYSEPQSDSARYWSHAPMHSGISFLHSRKSGNWDLVVGGNFQGSDGPLGPIVDSLGHFPDHGFNPFLVDRYESDLKGRINGNMRYRFAGVTGLSAGINTNWSKNESLSALLWENSGSGLYKAFDGSATRTRQLQGTVDPYLVYFTPRGLRHTLRLRWANLDNNNDNNQGNFSDVYYGEYQFQIHCDSLGIPGLTITSGLVGQHTDARGELFTGGEPDGHNKASNAAIYAQADQKVFGRFNISAGVRYEMYSLNDEAQSKPVVRGGLNYRLFEATFFRASYGQGYRFPSIAEKFIVTDVGALRIFPNPEIQPETSWNAEFGVNQGFKLGSIVGLLDAAIFRQEYSHFIEFTFGQWATPSGFTVEALQNSIGFKSINTGKARVDGIDITLMGEGHAGNFGFKFLAGYTYTQPVSLTPEDVYAISPVDPAHPLSAENFDTLTFINTSSDPTNNLLKYRMQHLVRADVSCAWKKWMGGISFRSNSHMQNIDLIFEQLEVYYPDVFNTGLLKWRAEHRQGDFVVDARVGYTFSGKHRFSLVINNLFNREYAIRPLAIEDPRVTMLQYTLTL